MADRIHDHDRNEKKTAISTRLGNERLLDTKIGTHKLINGVVPRGNDLKS